MGAAVGLNRALQNMVLGRLKRQLRAFLRAFREYVEVKRTRKDVAASVAATTSGRKQKSILSFWHSASHKAVGARAMLHRHQLNQMWLAFQAMCRLVTTHRKAQEVATRSEAYIAHDVIGSWSLAALAYGRARSLSAPAALAARSCLASWAYHCPVPSVLAAWREMTILVRRERLAHRFSLRGRSMQMQNILAAWSMQAARSQALHWRFKWRRALSDATALLHAWSRHTRLIAAARTRLAHCNCRLLREVVRWWRFSVVERRAELELQVGALRAWGFGAAKCRGARDETLWGRWVDEVAEAFAMRRLLRLILHGFAAWSSHACDVRNLQAQVWNRCCMDLKSMAFSAFAHAIAFARLANIDALLNGLSALSTLHTWNLHCKGMFLADAYQTALLREAWMCLQAGCWHRQACRKMVSVLEGHLHAWSCDRWQTFVLSSIAAEENARHRIHSLRQATALKKLHEHGQISARKTSLPRILRSWRQACRVARFTRRRELSHGLRTWKAYGCNRWAWRRRLAVADLLAVRRQLRVAWLAWQLLCFTETPKHDVLVDRWTDAVAAPGVLRPLVVLQASALNSTAPMQEEKVC